MKTVGKRKAKFKRELRRHVPELDDALPTWMRPCFGDILVPVALAEEIDKHTKAAKKRAAQARERRVNAQIAKRKEAAKPAEKEAVPHIFPDWYGRREGSCWSYRHRLYNLRGMYALARAVDARSGTTLRETADKARVKDMIERWSIMSGMRGLAFPGEGWRLQLDSLEAEMPNFSAVIEYLKGEFALAEAANQAPMLAPMLFDGPPGVGKTRFSRMLAAIIRTEFASMSMETAQTSTQLSGSEEHWGNSKPGLLFATLMEGEFSNPVFLIDEVEKAATSTMHDPLASLYGLLEPTTAAAWHDLAMPALKLDASRVIWVMTSNEKKRLPRALLSRMRVFDIPALSEEQSINAAKRIFAETVDRLQIDFESTLALPIAHALSTVSPREMLRLAREMIARAVLAGRRAVVDEDKEGTIKSIAFKEPLSNAKYVEMTILAEYRESAANPASVEDPSEAENDELDLAKLKMKMH